MKVDGTLGRMEPRTGGDAELGLHTFRPAKARANGAVHPLVDDAGPGPEAPGNLGLPAEPLELLALDPEPASPLGLVRAQRLVSDVGSHPDRVLHGRRGVQGNVSVIALPPLHLWSMPGESELPLTPFGVRLLSAAKEAGLTQTSLERAGGWQKGRLSRLVHREQDQLELVTIQKLRDLLGVRTDWLLFGEEPMREGAVPTPYAEAMMAAAAQGITYSVILRVKGECQEQAERENWTRYQWFEAIGSANKLLLKDAQTQKAQKRTDLWYDKRAKRTFDEMATQNAKKVEQDAAAAKARDDERKLDVPSTPVGRTRKRA
jgi:hypothetical protein